MGVLEKKHFKTAPLRQAIVLLLSPPYVKAGLLLQA
jgi:hypothetical protein